MGKPQPTKETVHKIELPAHHYSLLVAADGRFLSYSTEHGLTLTDQGDDSILWDQAQNREGFQHAVENQTLQGKLLTDRFFVASDQTTDLQRSNSDIEFLKQHREFTVSHGPAEKPSTYLQKLRDNGWVCLTKILSDEVVLELERTACTDRFEHLKMDRSLPAICQNSAVAITAAEPVSLWLIRQYMQIPDVKLGHTPALAVLRQDDGKRNVQGWHSDFPYHWGTGAKGQVPTPSGQTVMGVQRNVCVSDFTQIKGATAFKLGSHALDAGPPAEWGTAQTHGQPGYREANGLPYHGPDADIIEAPGGSIILYDSRTWHRAGVNQTENPRAAMLQAMIPMYILPKNDTSQSYRQFVQSEVYGLVDDRVKREIRNLMIHQFIGPGGRYVIAPDAELSELVRDTSAAY